MENKNLKALSNKMKGIDICTFTTYTSRGLLVSRPMSNNGDVDYEGDSYFFTYAKTRTVSDIKKHALVNLAFSGKDIYISVTGKANVIISKTVMEKHWIKSLETWFPDGIETKGICMIHVKAKRIKYWMNEKDAEIVLK